MEMRKRPRRLRANEGIRRLAGEVKVHKDDFILPLFVVEGKAIKREIPSMPDVFHYSADKLLFELEEIQKAGIPGVLLFGIPDHKDASGSEAWNEKGVVQKALREAKKHFPELLLITDVCLCEYTNHGHCGCIIDNKVDNDTTLAHLSNIAVSHAEAGADIVAPSDMMDGRVGAIRSALDLQGFKNTAIMAYSAKYASSFYGPFRDAAGSAPAFGDRKTYQMDYHGNKEAMKEIAMDIEEGADIVMIKPALAYLDIIKEASERFDYLLAAYQVSGEYCMIKAAAQKGWINEKNAMMETLTAIKRAGANILITYYAKEAAKCL